MFLEAKNITQSFGETDSKTYALRSAHLNLDYGEMLYLVGPSGSGKTTMLSIISGILRPNEGTVIVKGKDIWQMNDDDRSDFRLYSLGFVFQDFHLFPRLTSQENVAIPLILQKKSWEEAIEAAARSLEIVGLGHRMQFPPYKLSIGEQQRVAIARAIVTKPDLLVFDEPTASLDGETGQRIVAFIKDEILTKDRAIIVVTHDNRIYRFATRIVRIEDGKIIEQQGPLDED